MSIWSKLFGKRPEEPQTLTTTIDRPLRISNPVIGFVCVDPSQTGVMEQDKAMLGPLFHECRASATEIPPCHVLFLYCNLQQDGSLAGVAMRVRDFIEAAGACIAVVASENEPDHYLAAVEPENGWPANIVLVTDRNGTDFGTFFQKLFQAMLRGKSMLMAWVELAPQIPDHQHSDAPDTIMLAEAGHITLDGRG